MRHNSPNFIKQTFRDGAAYAARLLLLAAAGTTAVVEGGAALNRTPAVTEARAGTAIPGVEVYSICNPTKLVVENHTNGRITINQTSIKGTIDSSRYVEPHGRVDGLAIPNDEITTTVNEIPGVDHETIKNCSNPTTTTKGVTPTTNGTSTTSIPGGEQGVPVKESPTTTMTTTTSTVAPYSPSTSVPTNNENLYVFTNPSTSDQVNTAPPASAHAVAGRSLALTG